MKPQEESPVQESQVPEIDSVIMPHQETEAGEDHEAKTMSDLKAMFGETITKLWELIKNLGVTVAPIIMAWLLDAVRTRLTSWYQDLLSWLKSRGVGEFGMKAAA